MQKQRRGKLSLVRTGKRDAIWLNLSTGSKVPHDGIYRVHHSRHRLPREVTLLAGSDFPKCSRCEEPVRFELLRAIRKDPNDSDFRVILYEIPVVREPEAKPEPGERRAA